MESQDRVIEATLRVIKSEGLKGVTVRRVAQELGKSTTVITHYFANRQVLLETTLARALGESRASAEAAIRDASDPLWAFLDWSISEEHSELWEALLAAYAAGIDEEVSRQVDALLQWWDERFKTLLAGRESGGYSPAEICDIAGVVVEGILLTQNFASPSGISGKKVLRATLSSLISDSH